MAEPDRWAIARWLKKMSPHPALGAAGFGGTVHPLSEHTLALCGTRAGAKQLGNG